MMAATTSCSPIVHSLALKLDFDAAVAWARRGAKSAHISASNDI
jgi:hypothetical protein